MSGLNWGVLLPILAYLGVLYLVAARSNRLMTRSSSFLEEYFLGSRGMGAFVLGLTLVATYASGSSFLGGPGVAYKMGLGWVLLAMIQVPTALLTLGVLGKRFAILARRIGAVTLNDFLRARYESPWVVVLGAVAALVFFSAAMTAQFVAGGRLLQSVTGLPYGGALALFAGTVVLYTTVGGFRAVVLTDAVQGVVMLLGTLLLLGATVAAGGGIGHITATLRSIDPALLTPFGPGGFVSRPYILSFWVLVGFGVVGLPFSAVRCMGYRDSRSLHRGILLSTGVLAALMLGMHLAGVFGRAVLPNLTEVDRIIPELSLHLLPPVLAGLFLAGPLAAIMSTVDSQLILASAAVVKDLYLNYVAPGAEATPEGKARVKRLSLGCTALLGILPFLVAYDPPTIIVWINLFAFGGLEAAFLLPTVLGLYWKRANAPGALASMAVGMVSFVAIQQMTKRVLDMHVIVPSLALAAAAFVAVSLVTAPPKERVLHLFWGDRPLP